MTIRTALLEARLVLGDSAEFERLRQRFDEEIVAKTASEFVVDKLAERDARVRPRRRNRATSSSPISRRARAACAT